jgi:hypothetical protein
MPVYYSVSFARSLCSREPKALLPMLLRGERAFAALGNLGERAFAALGNLSERAFAALGNLGERALAAMTQSRIARRLQ